MRPTVAALAALVLLGSSAPASLSPAPAPRPVSPNVLVMYADDLGWGDLGSYGHHSPRRPRLDRLAAEGLRLTSYHAPSPLCSASRGADISGLFGAETLVREQPLFWEFDDDQGFHFALRDGRWKVLASEDLQTVRLYDLETDPFEVSDRALTRPDVLASLLAKIAAIDADVAADPLRPRR